MCGCVFLKANPDLSNPDLSECKSPKHTAEKEKGDSPPQANPQVKRKRGRPPKKNKKKKKTECMEDVRENYEDVRE
jgi:hypothetical protein